MIRKIFSGIVAISVVTLLLCFLLNIMAMHSHFTKQMKHELESEAHYIEAALEDEDISNQEYLNDVKNADNRITWIDVDGTVLFDNQSDVAQMDNHLDREEIKEALELGEGFADRQSDTISRRTIYYAKKLQNGTVLRVAGEQSSVWALIMGMAKPGILIVFLAIVLSAILAFHVSKKIIEPINGMDLSNPEEIDVYEELNPFLHKISRQGDIIKEQVENLKQKQREFAVITENMQEGFLMTDRNTGVLSYNSAALKLLGITELQENQSVLALNRSENFRKAVEMALEGNHNEQMMQTENACYYIYANPVFLHGEVNGVVVLILDATEKEMRNQLRREFTSNVSHELKTPLTSIYGVADMLQAGFVSDEDVPKFAGDIFKECKRMLNLIDDILRLSQLDEQSLIREKEPVDLYELSMSVSENLASLATSRGITVQVTGEHCMVSGVPAMLEEIVHNLATNAIKYNKENGSVVIDISKENGMVQLAVSDTGIGIPAEDTQRVFERFYRVDKSHSRAIGGTGLGLSIVKHAVQYHEGMVHLESVVNQGTTVTVSLKEI